MAGPRTTSARARALLTTGILAVGTCFLVLLLAPVSPTAELLRRSWAFPALYNGALVAAVGVVGLRAARPGPQRVAWALLTVGTACWVSGDLYWYFVVSGADPRPTASWADVGYLALFPFAYAGVVALVRSHTGRLGVGTWLDGAVAGLGVASIAGAFLLEPLLDGSGARTIPALAYPLGDLVLVSVIVTALAVLRWQVRRRWWMLLTGFLVLACTDTVYLFEVSRRNHPHPSLTDMGWPVALLAVAAASRMHGRPLAPAPDRVRFTSVVPLTSATGAVLVLLRPGSNWGSVSAWLATACIAAALARLALTLQETERLGGSHQLARTDELTGLPNWRAFYDHAGDLLHPARSGAGEQAVLLLDLDRFKEVNDSLGHLLGDELLRLVGPRLAAQMTPGDTLARLGGDEFGAVLAGHDAASASEVAERLCRSLDEPFDLDGVSVQIGVSVGIALAPEHGSRATELLQRADVAMYAAKRSRSGWRTYAPAEDPHSRDRLRTVESLRAAVKGRGGSLELHYQPKVRVDDGRLVGVEALVRWRHPERGLLYPDSFLDLVEESGLSRQLTDRVMEQALAQCARWRAGGLDVPVAVNLSATTVIDGELPAMVAARLHEHGLPASSLEVEITEAFLMSDRVRARGVLDELRALGVRVSVDDFGTGYSSLSYLRDLPIDQLKLDRSFISRMEGDEMAAALVRSTVSLAHSLGLAMVAEGVETVAVLDLLRSFRCDQAQGYLVSRPLPAAELERWVAGYQPRAASTLARSVSGVSATNPWAASQS